MARPADPRRRETILRAATDVFLERGFAETRLTDIARRAGIVPSTLYLYFESKEEMVRAIARENQRALLERLGPLVGGIGSEAGIARFVDAIVDFASRHRDQIVVVNLDAGLRAARRGTFREAHGRRIEEGVAIVAGLIEDGALRPLDPELVVETLIATTRWIMRRHLTSSPGERERLTSFCVRWLAGALLPPA